MYFCRSRLRPQTNRRKFHRRQIIVGLDTDTLEESANHHRPPLWRNIPPRWSASISTGMNACVTVNATYLADFICVQLWLLHKFLSLTVGGGSHHVKSSTIIPCYKYWQWWRPKPSIYQQSARVASLCRLPNMSAEDLCVLTSLMTALRCRLW